MATHEIKINRAPVLTLCAYVVAKAKPYKVGLQRSFAFEVTRGSGSGALFDALGTTYEKLVADGESVQNEEI